jgi:hypothetical protein
MKSSRLVLVTLVALLASLSALGAEREPLKITVGPEQIILPGGLQAFTFQSNKGTLLAQEMQMADQEIPLADDVNLHRWITHFVRSTDAGATWKTWTPTTSQGGGPIIEGEAAQLKDGTILILDWAAEGPKEGGYFFGKLWESHDEWQTVSGPTLAKFYLPDAIGGYDDGGFPFPKICLHRTMVEMPGGELLATAYGWFKGDSTPSGYGPLSYQSKTNKFRCFLVRSKDRGHNWSLVSTIAVDPTVGQEGFNEPVLVRVSQGKHQGRFIVHMRTGGITPAYQTESDDEGETWTKPHPLPWHAVDPDLIEMKNGILVAGFGWRSKEAIEWVPVPGKAMQEHRIGPEHGNYVAFSLDQGTTWTQVTQVNHELTTSYVTVREVAPGKLILVYDKNWWGHKDRAIAARFIDVRKQ